MHVFAVTTGGLMSTTLQTRGSSEGNSVISSQYMTVCFLHLNITWNGLNLKIYKATFDIIIIVLQKD